MAQIHISINQHRIKFYATLLLQLNYSFEATSIFVSVTSSIFIIQRGVQNLVDAISWSNDHKNMLFAVNW